MPEGFAPRFAVEAGFLILLGVGAGFADLRPIVIVAVLAGGWLIVSLTELAVWRAQSRPLPSYVPVPPRPEPEQEERVSTTGEDTEPDGTAYPLRVDAGLAPSEEVEAYTRILESEPEGEPPDESAE
jgi:hypothetical protein